MKKTIIITSIFKPGKVVEEYLKKKDYNLIIVGDKKTPTDYETITGLEFLSVKKQNKLNYHINSLLPFNHYCRKNIGYVHALKNNSQIIIDADDDNLPYMNWDFPGFNGNFEYSADNLGFVNIYNLFTDQHIWPRGLPLAKIKEKNPLLDNVFLKSKNVQVAVWQGLADDDPDVDAIYRLVDNSPCFFKKRTPIVLGKNTICPFNSQNTATIRDFATILYLPSTVTFRFTDILRGLVAQPILWQYDHYLGFTEATVKQERNPHDYTKDFISEIPCYLESDKIVDIVSSEISGSKNIHDNFFLAYEALYKNKIVEEKELPIVEAWLKDISDQ